MPVFLTILVFTVTLTLILTRPNGLNEAWATVLGGSLMLLLRLETPNQAVTSVTAVILTPIVLSFVEQLKLTPRPFLLACAFVANTGSLLLPVSNLTNLLFVSAFHWSFGAFAARMALPQIAALTVNYFLFRSMLTRDLPDKFDLDGLPESGDVIRHVEYFKASIFVLVLVLIGYFVGSLLHIQPYVIALTGCVVLFALGMGYKQVSWGILREISWPIFPFVMGLFVVVRGVENIGLAKLASDGLAEFGHSALELTLASSLGAGIGSNVVNNIPMALLAISALRHGGSAASQYGALLGCDLGPNLTVAGSLATMLVITSARKHGQDIGAKDFFLVGLRATPLIILAAACGLWLTLLL